MSTHHTALLAAVVAVVFAPEKLSTQQPAARRQELVPATVAMVDSLPASGVAFVVQRRPDRTPRDLILLGRGATAMDLSNAVRTLATARASDGDYPFKGATVRMRPHQKSQKAQKEIPWTHGTMARLRKAKPRNVDGAGTVPAVAIWLPKQSRGSGSLGVPKNPK